jgi:hypothetical protein
MLYLNMSNTDWIRPFLNPYRAYIGGGIFIFLLLEYAVEGQRYEGSLPNEPQI